MRSGFKEPSCLLVLALVGLSCVPAPAPVGVGVTVPVASAPPPPRPPPPPPPRPIYRPFESGFTRPGADYRSFELPAANPEMCREICYREPRCAAFTYVHPRIQGPYARCFLKAAVPPAMPNGCCISGMK